jgi:hypothetical protein
VQTTKKVDASKVVTGRRAVLPKRRVLAPPTKIPPRRPPRDQKPIRRAESVAPLAPSSGGARGYLALLLVMGLGLGLSALVAAAALVPANALPMSVSDRLEGRRELLISASAALAVGIAAGLLVVVLS